MKTLTHTLILILSAIVFCHGQSHLSCNPYVPTSKGSKWEITNYSAKGKETGKISSELVDVVSSENETTFTIKSTYYDKKREELFSNTYDAKCVNGKFELNMAMRMDGSTMKAYENMEVQIDGSDFDMPSIDEKPGTTLKDGKLTVNLNSDAGMALNMNVMLTDRKVEKKEEITTPAGSFPCIAVSQKITTRMVVNVQVTSREWYASEVGMVRSESYSKNGKLTGYSELTLLSKE